MKKVKAGACRVPQTLAALLLLSVHDRPREGVRWASHLLIGFLIGVATLFNPQSEPESSRSD